MKIVQWEPALSHATAWMMKSRVQPPHWMEDVVVGAGVLTVLLTNPQLESIAALSTAFLLGFTYEAMERIAGTKVLEAVNIRPHCSTGLLLGNILVPMVTASTLPRVHSLGSPETLTYLRGAVMLLSMLTPTVLLLCTVMKFTMHAPVERQIANHLWIIPLFGLASFFCWLRHRLIVAVFLAVATPASVYFFMTRLLDFLPRSFSLGEAVLVAHSLVLLMLHAAYSLTANVGKLLSCLQVLVLGCVVILFAVFPVAGKLHSLSCQHRTRDRNDCFKGAYRSHVKLSVCFYLCLASAIVVFLLPWLGFLLQERPLLWGIVFVTATKTRMLLLCLWACLVLAAGGVVTLWGSASTIVRKYFHILAICIYLPGILLDVQLLYLASTGTLFILILLEMLRVFRVWPVGDILHDAFRVFIDDQDCGTVILTHIYLLLGMSLPIWLHQETASSANGGSLALYSGILSLGVGDTAAALIGSLYGKIRWPGCKKTLEGTCAAIVSQLLACRIILYLDPHLTAPHDWLGIIWAVILTSVLEAVTTQIDNLVLPLFMYSLLFSLEKVPFTIEK